MHRVVEVVGSLAVGGAERVAIEVAAGLASRGHAASLLSAGPSVAHAGADSGGAAYQSALRVEAERRGVPVHHVPFTNLRDRGSRRRVRAFLEEQGVELVHVHNRPQDWQFVAMCRLLGIPVVYTIHLPYQHASRKSRAIYAAAARLVPQVVCVSRTVADHVHAHEGIPRARLRVIYNGIRMELFKPAEPAERARLRAEIGWREDDVGFLVAARLAEQKGHTFLLDAFARLPPTSKARLALAGDGALESSLKAQAERLGLGARVTFLGARRDVPALLGAADAYACASLQEGHPLSLLEAMAVELPVVAPRLPSVVEIATDGAPVLYGPTVSGWATAHDPGDVAAAVREVEERLPLHREKAKASRLHVERTFSREAMIDAHEALYDRMLATYRPSRVRDLAARALF